MNNRRLHRSLRRLVSLHERCHNESLVVGLNAALRREFHRPSSWMYEPAPLGSLLFSVDDGEVFA